MTALVVGKPRRRQDELDKLLVFLAKRDGIDKLVKTFQYIFKLAHWRLQSTDPDLARRCQLFEISCGLSRKAFRTGRFLTGLNTLRKQKSSDWKVTLLTLFGCSGEMVYFFFDHFTWMSKVGLLESQLAARTAYISAFGESVLYIAMMTLDVIMINRDSVREEKLEDKLRRIEEKLPSAPVFSSTSLPASDDDAINDISKHAQALSGPLQALELQAQELRGELARIQEQRVSRCLSIAAQFADLLIALNTVKPRPLWAHPLTLGVSGFVSAWSGWYRLWPA